MGSLLPSVKHSQHEGIRRAFETEADLGLWQTWASLEQSGHRGDDCSIECEEGARGEPLHDYPGCNLCFDSAIGIELCSFTGHYLEHMLLSQFYTPIHEIPWVLAEYSRLKAHFAEMEDSSAGMAGLDGKLWKGLKKARVLVETARTNGDCNTSVISELDATLAYLQGENLRVMAANFALRW
ncbi:hypothetical protein CC1G_12559 [Coprinopsis cinerea okayama7|uniref:Uncharacterized protein n=1 Tax=Coprinopsis cinerea (strain Okayama-7 / 130 / ATCC MYA-4618 / FGSC 9003) TaxID=240176 RepID=A8PH89_COPC7|nr:hypothetical protein CC1G_12559 [Coprinopsis cinerea okayama7\|eukprot:XP_001841361.2 hypothetical protein CC1G_12559 [Coprinopsis cinerea okayama7\